MKEKNHEIFSTPLGLGPHYFNSRMPEDLLLMFCTITTPRVVCCVLKGEKYAIKNGVRSR